MKNPACNFGVFSLLLLLLFLESTRSDTASIDDSKKNTRTEQSWQSKSNDDNNDNNDNRAAAAAACDTVSCRFKAPNPSTPAKLAQTWHDEDQALWHYVEEHVPAVLQHTGTAAFDEHLKGVQAVLRYWQAPTRVTNAGLLHSIYGTEGFQGFALPLSERAAIQSLIGIDAEYLCFVFCMVDRATVDETVFAWTNPAAAANIDGNQTNTTFTFWARPELGRFPMRLNREQWLDFIELTLADWLEQVEGAAQKPNDVYSWQVGQAYVYRRRAYRTMSQILATERADRLAMVVPQMYDAVMATEDVDSRHLEQPRTPPMSAAAATAWLALKAAGEPGIPDNYAPQPVESCDSL